ncbi:MAG: site-2 protease family protein [Chloroflexi bacterium]|nr:site-2 protease family protein [Chloroflexota bacterium]
MPTFICRRRNRVLSQLLSGQFEPTEVLGMLIALILGITVHEFAHAAAATWLGDSLPRQDGRLTLAPHAHLDVMGSLMFLVAGFGWGRAVRYNPYALRAGLRTGPALVALAGPVSNILLAIIFAIPARLLALYAMTNRGVFTPGAVNPLSVAYELLTWIVLYNLILALYNLIPIFPLDGFSVLLGVLPPQMAEWYERTRQYGMFILLLLVFAGGSVLGVILYRPVGILWRLLIGV